MPSPVYIAKDITRFIDATGESENIDAKAAVTWDGHASSAGLAKDIVAFANSRDGGVIVLGKFEEAPGKFRLEGLTDTQANSFDTTKVCDWINARFAPPIQLTCHRQEHVGKTFVVITISEFGDVPHICTKSLHDQANGKNLLLRQGAVYVRTASASSAPLGSVDELRALIGLATAKRRDEMLSFLDSMLKGRPLIPSASDIDLYDKEFDRISTGLEDAAQKMIADGAWILRVYPSSFIEERWSTSDELKEVIQRRSVRLRSEFPPQYREMHMRGWGLCDNGYDDLWTLARSGQFVAIDAYSENNRDYVCPWRTTNPSAHRPDPRAAAGEWLDFKSNIYQIIEWFMFLVRFVEEFDSGATVLVEFRATNLSGRKLLTFDWNLDFDIHFRHQHPCREPAFCFKKRISVEELRAGWEGICAEAMKRFVDLFPGDGMSVTTMQAWIDRFKVRNF